MEVDVALCQQKFLSEEVQRVALTVELRRRWRSRCVVVARVHLVPSQNSRSQQSTPLGPRRQDCIGRSSRETFASNCRR